MNTKHDPGPWRTSESAHRNEWSHWIMTGGNRDATIAAVTQIPQAPEKSDANARLIAAAPELLEACRSLLEEFDRYDAAMTAIGRGHEDFGRQREAARAAVAKATHQEPNP